MRNTARDRTDAEVEGANWATDHSEFHDFSDLRMEAVIEAETRFGEFDENDGSLGNSFVAGAMRVRGECCVRKGY